MSQSHTLFPTLQPVWEMELTEWVFCQNALAQMKIDIGEEKEGISLINFYKVLISWNNRFLFSQPAQTY